jgi:hypothetical protein
VVWELSQLLGEIERSQSFSYKIKWLVSSRNDPLIEKGLGSLERPSLSLELNSGRVSHAVGAKVAKLAQMKGCDLDLKAMVEMELSFLADRTRAPIGYG